MKENIIILTDFSENAASAAETGLALSSKLGTDLLLYHTYIDYPALPYASGGGWDLEEYPLKKKQALQRMECLLEGLESLATQSAQEDRQPTISFLIEDGDLGVELSNLLENRSVEMIVMGARSEHPDDPLSGDDTKAVIRHADRPVLVVPAGTIINQVHKIVFATDFEPEDLEAIRYIKKLCQLFGFGMEVIHVDLDKSKTADRETAFKDSLDALHATGVQYEKLNGKDLVRRINQFVSEKAPVILALRHHHYPFFIDLFVQSKSKELLAKQKTPLLIFPQTLGRS